MTSKESLWDTRRQIRGSLSNYERMLAKPFRLDKYSFHLSFTAIFPPPSNLLLWSCTPTAPPFTLQVLSFLPSALPGSKWWEKKMGEWTLLHKKINWASESGCWLMCGAVQSDLLAHSPSFIPLALSGFDLSGRGWRHSGHLGVTQFCQTCPLVSFIRLRANRIYRG